MKDRRYPQRTCLRLGTIALLAYAVLGLWPFRWNPPRHVENGAHITADGILHIPTEGCVSGRESGIRWADEAVRGNAFRIKLRVRALGSSGPIFNYSNWFGGTRNIMIGQHGSDLIAAMRTPMTDQNGSPGYTAPGVFSDTEWHDIELNVEHDVITISVDRNHVETRRLPRQALSAWERHHHFVFVANETGGTQPWLGEIAECVAEAGGVRWDLFTAADVLIPPTYSVNLKVNGRLSLDDWTDCLANFLCFVPVGFVLSAIRRSWRTALIAVLVCSLASCVVELLQFPFDRMPSITDWVMNSAGAIVGSLAAQWVMRRQITVFGGLSMPIPAWLRAGSGDKFRQ